MAEPKKNGGIVYEKWGHAMALIIFWVTTLQTAKSGSQNLVVSRILAGVGTWILNQTHIRLLLNGPTKIEFLSCQKPPWAGLTLGPGSWTFGHFMWTAIPTLTCHARAMPLSGWFCTDKRRNLPARRWELVFFICFFPAKICISPMGLDSEVLRLHYWDSPALFKRIPRILSLMKGNFDPLNN